MAKESLAQKRR